MKKYKTNKYASQITNKENRNKAKSQQIYIFIKPTCSTSKITNHYNGTASWPCC